jgi:nucleotide-binding universal stress UspA family protein
MTHYLVATRSVHTTAAACDYLTGELSDGDAVTVLTVDDGGGAGDDRDGGDALNVAVARLSGLATVERERREGDPGEAILAAAGAAGADRIVLGARRGEPGTDRRVGLTAERVLAAATVPVVVVPLPEL